ncbi:MAG: peptide chain release factor N(5)-glutamine methyltransferase [Neisseriaceae bacterium]|nr:peptide chain release factor N(5)-glutamine methyltransferase [Neisseriaceae bacterium]
MTIHNWIKQSPLPRLESRMLLQAVLGLSSAQIVTHSEDKLSDDALHCLNALQQRRIMGEPMAYILGEREFYGRVFCVNQSVLIPRPETELLLETALFRLPETPAIVWDLGCGSGILAISIKLQRPDCTVWASDISDNALKIAQKNAQRLQATIEWTQGDWYDCFRQPEKNSVDIIISNPPYIAGDDAHLTQGDLCFEPQNALTDFADGLTAYRTLINGAGRFLKKGGEIWLEHGFEQGESVRQLLANAGFSDIQTFSDLAGLERVTGGCFRLPETF